MRPGTLDVKREVMDDIMERLEEAAESGNFIRYTRNRNADGNAKQAIMPESDLDKSIVCRHLKMLRDEGRVEFVVVGYDKVVVTGHTVAYEIVELHPH